MENHMTTNPIHYVPGKGKSNRAAYLVGTEKVPAAVITRLLKALQGQTGGKIDRLFYQGLDKYPSVLDAIDTYGLMPSEAVAEFAKIQQENEKARAPKQERATKVEKAAETFAKGICKRFKGSPEEVVAAFLDIVAKPEFRTEAIDVISAYHKNFGQTSLGFIKTSNRKGNPAAQKALAKHRAQDNSNK
jgi:hypothetical protein